MCVCVCVCDHVVCTSWIGTASPLLTRFAVNVKSIVRTTPDIGGMVMSGMVMRPFAVPRGALPEYQSVQYTQQMEMQETTRTNTQGVGHERATRSERLKSDTSFDSMACSRTTSGRRRSRGCGLTGISRGEGHGELSGEADSKEEEVESETIGRTHDGCEVRSRCYGDRVWREFQVARSDGRGQYGMWRWRPRSCSVGRLRCRCRCTVTSAASCRVVHWSPLSVEPRRPLLVDRRRRHLLRCDLIVVQSVSRDRRHHAHLHAPHRDGFIVDRDAATGGCRRGGGWSRLDSTRLDAAHSG
jgi:hypothetical protein